MKMEKKALKHLLDVAAGREAADLVIMNSKIVDVYNGVIVEGKNIAIVDGKIAGIGDYHGKQEIDAKGQYAVPGFIDSHIHIESSYVTPEEIGRLMVVHGTTAIITDPHEMVNIFGIDGLDYMMKAASNTKLDIQFVLPSCVPATPFENSGAVVNADLMQEPIQRERILGLGEFMNFPGVINADDAVLEKLLIAKNADKLIDGHSPSVHGNNLNAYAAAGVHTDHECSTVEEMKERIQNGMYVQLREGSACHDLRPLLKGITPFNSRRCVLCSDDRHPQTLQEEGHLDHHLRICVEEGIDPITAIQMATCNAAECYHLNDRGAIAPGLRADIALLDNLTDFQAKRVFICGEEVAKDGVYLPDVKRYDISAVTGAFHVKDFSIERLKMNLQSNRVHVIGIQEGGILTKNKVETVTLSSEGDFVFDPDKDIAKIAVVERHHATGNVAVALISEYGIKHGAIAISIAHDSHNIITVGTNNKDMSVAVQALIAQGGGIVLVNEGKFIGSMPMVVGGIMSDQSGEWVSEKLSEIHEIAYEQLGISRSVEPVMTLCFMSLAVIPEVKLTDMGLFDVTQFAFISVEA